MKQSRFVWAACAMLLAIGLLSALAFTNPSAARVTASPAVASNAAQRDRDLERVFRQHELVKMDTAGAIQQVCASGSLRLQTSVRALDLVLIPNDMRAPGYQAMVTASDGLHPLAGDGPVRTFKGSVRGMAGSEVRLTIDEQSFEGLILTPDARYFIEPARRYTAGAASDDFVLYDAADVIKGENTSCGNATLNERVAAAIEEAAPRAPAAAALAPAATLLQVELATEADFEYVTLSESAPGAGDGVVRANNEILSIMNQVDGVYRNELGLTFLITFQHAWATPDPFSDASQGMLLTSFQAYWNNTFTNVQRDLTHLWSGSPVTNLTGLTYVGQVCNAVPGNAYGIHGRVVDAPQKFILAAHEIGHSLGAPVQHPDTVPGCAGTIMASSSGPNSVLTFCQASRDAINAYVATHTSCLTMLNTRRRFDFDGDGKADIAVFRPGDGNWYVLNSATGGFMAQAFGTQGDLPAPEDFDGDGRTDYAVFRPSSGEWYLLQTRAGFSGRQFGANGDRPVSNDYDGDGRADIAVYRPSTGAWYILNSGNGVVVSLAFGTSGDLPAPADYDGDGRADIAVFRPSSGVWYIQQSRDGFRAQVFGTNGDRPAPVDFDGDSKADVVVFRPSSGSWYLQQSTAGFKGAQFGTGGDVPVPADYDGDGKADVGVWRPTNGGWYTLNSSNGGFRAQAFGTQGDVPVPGAYVP